MKYIISKKDESIKTVPENLIEKFKNDGRKLFDSYEDAVKSRGEFASQQMEKKIRAAKFEQTPEAAKIAGGFVLPATYEALRHGEEPGFKESSIDAALMASNFIPGGQTLRALPIAGKIASGVERTLLANKTPIVKNVLPKLASDPTNVAGEALIATGVEGLTSQAQDREFDPTNVALSTVLGTAAARILPTERTRLKSIEAMKTVPGSELDKRFNFEDMYSKVKPGTKISELADSKIEDVLKEIINKNKIDFRDQKAIEALKKRVKAIIKADEGKYSPSLDRVDDVVNTFVGDKVKYSARSLARLPELPNIGEDKIVNAIRRSAPVAIADVVAPSQSSYLRELGRLKSFDSSIEESPAIAKIPVVSSILRLGGKALGIITRGGRTYLPTLRGLEEEQ